MLPRSQQAVIVIIFSVFALALGDALIKQFSTNLVLWQIFVLRSVVVVPVLLIFIKLRYSNLLIWPKELVWTVLRSLLLTLMWVIYYISLPHVELSIAAAAFYTLPLFITLFAALLLSDEIGWLGWLAILLGFIGVILILEPRAEDFNRYALLPICSAILYALAMILTRSKCRLESVPVLSLWLNFTMIVIGIIGTIFVMVLNSSPSVVSEQKFLLGSWSSMGATEWSVIGLLAIAILIGSLGAAFAYQNGVPATIATFDFAYVGFAALWGFFLFHETLTLKTITGIMLIVIAGILAVRK